MDPIAAWGIVIFICVLLGMYAEYVRLRKKKYRFADRENLPIEEIYLRYYSGSGLATDSVLDIWKGLSKCFSIAPGLLRPSDRFDTQLAPVRGFPTEDELIDVEEYICERAARLGVSFEMNKLETLDDVIRLLALPIYEHDT